jgi:putative nucleotidyltransferase with HDIG domain
MTTVSNATFRQSIGDSFSKLAARLGGVGVNLWLWDRSGLPASELEPRCELCRAVSEAGADCRDACCQLARKAVSQQQRRQIVLPTGCCVMALPLRCRRRVVGAATACYPSREMAEEESLLRHCSRLKLDSQVIAAMAERDCRYRIGDAEHLADIVDSALESEQAEAIARDELANLSTNLAATYEELSLLYRISGSMRVTREPADFLHTICEDMLEVMNISAAAAVEYARPSVGGPETVVIAGELDLPVQQLRHLLADLVAHRFGEDNRPIVDNSFAPAEGEIARTVRNFVAVPLMTEDSRIGLVVGLNKLDGDFDSIDLKLLGSIGNQASVFLANSRMYAERQDLLMGVLHALTATIDAKDPYTCGHSQRVAIISRRIAEEMEFPPDKVEKIYLCGLLHDIGKIGVPESVLTKPGRLDEQEYEKVRMHPIIGARILGGIRQLDEVIDGLLTHHERPDGCGYPYKLSGENLSLDGLIIGLADSFDAMSSDRTYRKAMLLDAVIGEIRKHAGLQFDKKVVDVFLSMDLEKLLEEARQEAETVFPVGAVEGR